MKQRLLQQLSFAKPLRLALVLSTLLLTLPLEVKAQIPWIFIGHYDNTTQATLVGTMVTDANADNVLGDNTVSYANGVLTLNGANINGCIYSSGALTIDLKGTNIITAKDSCAIKNTNGTVDLAFKSTDGTGKLEMKGKGNPCTSGFNSPTYQNELRALLGAYNSVNAVIGKQLFSGGTGTSSDPYIIGSVSDLKSFALYFNNNWINTNVCAKIGDSVESLDFSGINDFEPIGDDNNMFNGTFDGNNKIIKNLSVTNVSGEYVGLFRYLNGGTITKLILDGCTISGGSGSYWIGGIVGDVSNNGTISNCTVQNSTISCANDAQNPAVGGIVSYLESGNITECILLDSYVKAETELNGGVSGPSAKAGGIAGQCEGSISNCQVKGTTEISARNVSGSNPLAAGAVFGYTTSTSLTLVGNTYNSSVKTKTKEGDSDYTIKQNYEQRGIGSLNDDDPGAMLAGTKKITVSDYDISKGDLSLSVNNEAYCVIERNVSSNKATALYVIPTQNLAIKASLANGVENIKSRLTVKNGTADIGMTATEVENTTTHVYTHTEYAFTMPDANLTATLSFPIDIASATFTATIADGYYTGTAVVPTQMTLAGGTNNYTLTTANNDFTITGYTLGGTAVTEPVEAGTYTVSVEGKGDYIGTRDVSYKIIMTYALKIKDIQVNELNKDNILGSAGTATVSFTPATATTPNKLALNGASFEGKIENGLDELTIEFTGTNSLTGTSGYITSTNNSAKLKVKGVTNAQHPTSTLSFTNTTGNSAVEGFADVTFDGAYLKADIACRYKSDVKAIKYVDNGNAQSVSFTTEVYYPLWIYNQQVSSGNYTDILLNSGISGTASYNSSQHILTLDNVSISNSIVIESELSDNLTIAFKGNNSLEVSTGNRSPIMSGVEDAALTFQKVAGTGDCRLNIGFDSGVILSAPIITGFASVDYTTDNLYYVSKTGTDIKGNSTYDAILSSSAIYPLWVAGTMVTGSASSGTGWSYDGNTNTLTLENYASSYNGHAFAINMPSLNVYLKGTNTVGFNNISGYQPFYSYYNNATLTFSTDENNMGKLDASYYDTFCNGSVNEIYCNNGLGYYPTRKIEAKKTPTIKFVTRDQTNGNIPTNSSDYVYVAENGTIGINYVPDFYAPKPIFSDDYLLSDTTRYEYTMSVDGVVEFALGGTHSGNPGKIDYANDGKVYIHKSGIVTITCTFPGNMQNKACSASYTFKITRDFNNPFANQPAEQIYATYYNGDEDLTLPDGITAYVITGISGNTVTTTATGYLPHEVPVLLEKTGNVGTTITGYTGSAGNFSGNLLKYADQTFSSTGKEYVLYMNEFVKATGNIPGSRCYLDLSSVNPSRGMYGIGDGTTSIRELRMENEGREEWYDLQGRRIQQPTKAGLYIKNGKKVIVNIK